MDCNKIKGFKYPINHKLSKKFINIEEELANKFSSNNSRNFKVYIINLRWPNYKQTLKVQKAIREGVIQYSIQKIIMKRS